MKFAFYKKWKKIALVLTSIFWASCGDDSNSSSSVLYSCPSDECNPKIPSSSSSNIFFSSSEENIEHHIPDSTNKVKQDTEQSNVSHNNNASSSNLEEINSSSSQEEEFIDDSSFDEPSLVYGPPSYFNDSCSDDSKPDFSSSSFENLVQPLYGIVEKPFKEKE